MKPKPNFSIEDLVGELREAVPDIDQSGATTTEIARALDVSQNYVLRRLGKLKRCGRLIVVRKTITKLDDTVSSVVAYKLVMEEDDESEESSIGGFVSVAGNSAGYQPSGGSTDV